MTTAILYEHANFEGESLFISSSDANLTDDVLHYFFWWPTASWNGNVSSLKLFDGDVYACERAY